MFLLHKLTSAQIRSWITVMLNFLFILLFCYFNPYQFNV